MKVVSRETRLSMRKPWQAKAAADAAVGKKASRYYPAEDVKQKLNNHHNNNKQTKLKKSISAGSVLILLAGRFKGSRVVFLKQLESGLLLVTGPYKCNGVPIRRINQAYVIGTSTVVDVSGVNVPAHIDDKYFSRVSQPKEGEEGFFSNQEKINPEWLSKRQADQEALDTQVLKAVDKTPLLAQYLGAKFTLSKGQAPHNLKF